MDCNPGRREELKEIRAVLWDEAEWRRVKNFVVFLHTGRPNLSNITVLWLVLLIFNQYLLFDVLLGGLSSADWSVRMLGGGGSMPTTTTAAAAAAAATAAATAAAVPDFLSSKVTLSSRRQSKVLENRDLCRIITSYIPKPML